MSSYEADIDLREVRESDDIDWLLDIRANALRTINQIDLEIRADETMPRPDHFWRKRAYGAIRFQSLVARTASARLLQIAPKELEDERANDPPPSVSDLQASIDKLTSALAAERSKVGELERSNAALKQHINQHVAGAEAREAERLRRAEVHRLAVESAAERRAQKLEAQRVRDESAGQRFIDAAKSLLPHEQYMDIWRAAGMDRKGAA